MDFDGVVTRFQQLLKPTHNKRKSTDYLPDPIPWNWICSHLITLLEKYASGATEAIILSELQSLWDETSEDWNDSSETRIAGLNMLGETPLEGMLEVRVVNIRLLPDTQVWAVTLTDSTGTQMDHYLHPQQSRLANGPSPLLVPGRCVRLVGTRKTTMGNPPRPVLLPTQHIAVMLGTAPKVNDDHMTDPLFTIALGHLQQFRNSECTIAAKVVGVRGTTIHLSAPNSPHVVLELTREHRLLGHLVRKGEILRIQARVPPNYEPSSPSGCIIEYVAGSICVLTTNASPTGANVESLLGGAGIRDMRYVKTRLRVSDIVPSLSGVDTLARVLMIGRNKPTSAKLNRYPLQLTDTVSDTHPAHTVDVTVWETGLLAALKVGMLVYAENLSSTSPKDPLKPAVVDNYHVVASNNFFTRLRAISTLQAILTSSLFPVTPLSSVLSHSQSTVPYIHHPTNFIVRATLLDYHIPIPEKPVYLMHVPCQRKPKHMTDFAELECRFCNMRSHESAHEWENFYELEWKIGDGSAECMAQATPKVSEGIMKMRASVFSGLDTLRQKSQFDSILPANYLLSISIVQEGQKKNLRIDQLVQPNPIVETKKLLDDLDKFPW